MTTEAETFRARADAEAALAAQSDLANVRDRHLRSQAAWEAMATRSERVATQRARNEAAKAAG
ncbi:hypothetical protein [Stakelama tenebrarum]|uniref:Uncharacterized protein n=1 Tax=Stakelama tenebrarum TaxID=2711215 RepID=A0A6G6Y2T0_9SPHN|nr:hypothetical protein [Sphingosinithalassobacter tenebrarum]QIG79209.1 hypothetical protein G5C33_04990 [Sphingosinithalassobacter tenebrarum]